MFFFCTQASGNSLTLATDLFDKGEWSLCRRECKRALLSQTEPMERFQLLQALSGAETGAPPDETIRQLQQIIHQTRDLQISSIASYKLGRILWQQNQPEQAVNALAFTFNSTTNKPLFLRAACSAFLLMKEFPALKKTRADLVDQINTSRDQWYGPLFGECKRPGTIHAGQPNWLVRFYRAQISPAIGNRCTLEPSCSEYFQQAYGKHSLIAVPMTADRFFREPGVNNEKRDPVLKNEQIRYRDPVENHDFWMKP